MNQNPQVQKLLDSFAKDIKTAEVRRDTAISIADNLEKRNKLALDGLDKQALEHEKALKAKLAKIKAGLEAEIKQLKKLKSDLQDEITALVSRQTELIDLIKALDDERQDLQDQIVIMSHTLADLKAEESVVASEIETNRGLFQNLRQQVAELNKAKDQLIGDNDILGAEVEHLENAIVAADAELQARKIDITKQIKGAEAKLNEALARLTETVDKDRAIRQSWADEHARIDKRIATVRRAEARLSESEARVQELDRYSKL